jgi:CheY-like chemotaxis protein
VTDLGSLNVLVVDDDRDIRFLIGGIFRDIGYAVREAEHGQRALDVLLIEQWRPHVILLDIKMPVMDGLTFLAKKRVANGLSAIPVIIVSATARAPIDGACCVLSKPVDPDHLVQAVHRVA